MYVFSVSLVPGLRFVIRIVTIDYSTVAVSYRVYCSFLYTVDGMTRLHHNNKTQWLDRAVCYRLVRTTVDDYVRR